MDEQIKNNIVCKCGKRAIILYDNKWVCGDCAVEKHNEKPSKLKRIWRILKCQ